MDKKNYLIQDSSGQFYFPFILNYVPEEYILEKSNREVVIREENSFLEMSLIDFARKHLQGKVSFNRKQTAGYMLCLYHKEKTPSLRIKSDNAICFGCGIKKSSQEFILDCMGS